METVGLINLVNIGNIMLLSPSDLTKSPIVKKELRHDLNKIYTSGPYFMKMYGSLPDIQELFDSIEPINTFL